MFDCHSNHKTRELLSEVNVYLQKISVQLAVKTSLTEGFSQDPPTPREKPI